VVASGRPALSHFEVTERFRDVTLLRVVIETGRTHQIRVHFAYIGHPLVGDRTYSGRQFRYPLNRQFLHASGLRFQLPRGRLIEVETPLPRDLQKILTDLQRES